MTIVRKSAVQKLRSTETHRAIAVDDNDNEDEMEYVEEVPVVEREGMLREEEYTVPRNRDDRTCDTDYGSASGEEKKNCEGCAKCRCKNYDTSTVLHRFVNRLVCRCMR